MASIHDIPDDVVSHVFSFLDSATAVCSARTVCKQWAIAGTVSSLWKEMFAKTWGVPLRDVPDWYQFFTDHYASKKNILNTASTYSVHGVHTHKVCCVQFVRNETEDFVTGSLDGFCILWNGLTKEPKLTMQGHGEGHTANSGLVVVDNKFVITENGETNTPLMYDLATGKQVMHFEGHTSKVYVMQEKDGQLLTASGPDVRLFDLEKGTLLYTVPTKHTEPVWRAELIDKNRILTAGWDGFIYLWDMNKTECIRSWNTDGIVQNMVYDAANETMVYSASQNVYSEHLVKTSVHKIAVGTFTRFLCLLKHKECVFSTTRDGEVIIFNYAVGVKMETLPGIVGKVNALEVFGNLIVVSAGNAIYVFHRGNTANPAIYKQQGVSSTACALRLDHFRLLSGTLEMDVCVRDFRGKDLKSEKPQPKVAKKFF